MLEATYRARSASKTRYFAGLFRRACCLPLARPSRDDRRCHRDLVILAPGRPDGPPQLEEVRIEVLDAQRLARCVTHLLRVVPVDGPTARLGRGGYRLAVHDPVGDVLRPVVRDPLGNG